MIYDGITVLPINQKNSNKIHLGMGNDGAMKYIKNGGTMERPNECPDSIHNLMRKCWTQLPEDRPTFLDICQHLLPHSNQR